MPHRTRVLIVDDSPRARASLRARLAIDGEDMDIQEAENGLEALECIAKAAPDVVFMDVMMDALGGIEATKRIKADAPRVKVIALSFSPDYASAALAAGADAFVCKGDPPAVLLRAFARIAGLQEESGEPQ